MRSHRFKTTTRSKGEKEIKLLLKKMYPFAKTYINYPYYDIVKECTDKRITADFYIKTYGIVIEVNGEHHYQPVYYKSDEKTIFESKRRFKETQIRDAKKKAMIEGAGLVFIVIPYFEWEKLKNMDEKEVYLYDKIHGV